MFQLVRIKTSVPDRGNQPLTSRSHLLAAQAIITNLSKYFKEIMLTKGTRPKEKQQVMLNVLAAVCGDNIRLHDLITATARVLGIQPRLIRAGILSRKSLEEAPGCVR